MAKKNIKKKDHQEVIANCDKSQKDITKSDDLQFEVQNLHLKHDNLEELIYTFRGCHIMIDSDLADIYEVETKYLKRAVKANIDRFPEDFMFVLSTEEIDILRCKNGTSNKRGGTRYPPFAFTQAGVAMLSGLLHSKIAVDANIRIMRAFVGMQRYMAANAQVFQRLERVELQQIENKYWMQETDDRIETILNKIEERSPKLLPEQIFGTGCVWDAWAFVSDLVRSAKQQIILIDNFVDDRVLSLLDKRSDGVTATIHSRYNESFLVDLKKHNEQYREINFIQLPHKSHDRFLIIDDDVYLLGASVKDMGVGVCAITKMEASPEAILQLLK